MYLCIFADVFFKSISNSFQTINNDSVVADSKGDAFSVMLDR